MLGPISEESLLLLVKQGRIQLCDYVWCEDINKWQRLMEIPPFSALLPPYPKDRAPNISTTNIIEPKLITSSLITSAKLQIQRDSHKTQSEETQFTASVVFEKDLPHEVVKISERGLLFKPNRKFSIQNKEVVFQLLSPLPDSPFQMTGILVQEEIAARKNAYEDRPDKHDELIAIEFTRLNPIYRRQIKSYVDRIKVSK